MMTPEQEQVLLNSVASQIDAEMERAWGEYQRLVLAGSAPVDAVDSVLQSFDGQYATLMAAAFSQVMAEQVGTPSVLAMRVGEVTLSEALYANREAVQTAVRAVVAQHVEAISGVRELALDLFEGYGFREQEVLTFARADSLIPKYIKDALLPDLEDNLVRAFAQLQVEGLQTNELRAAYQQVLDALDRIEAGAGRELLLRRLRVAFYEKARYLANRIAQTELHRAYSRRRAKELLDDSMVQYVRWTLSITHPEVDICDYYAGVDQYGLGRGVYPKLTAPSPPAHPHCRCTLATALVTEQPRFRPNAGQTLLRSMDQTEAAKVAGSRAKLQRALDGEDVGSIHNEGTPDAYRVKTLDEAADDFTRMR